MNTELIEIRLFDRTCESLWISNAKDGVRPNAGDHLRSMTSRHRRAPRMSQGLSHFSFGGFKKDLPLASWLSASLEKATRFDRPVRCKRVARRLRKYLLVQS